MNKKYLLLVGLLLPIVFFIGLIAQLQIAAWDLPIVRVAVRGYDPRDLISGHYLNLRVDWKKTDCKQFSQNKCPEMRFRNHYVYYIPETKARSLEKLLSEPDIDTQLVFSYPPKGFPQVLDFEINGKSWIEYTFKQPKK